MATGIFIPSLLTIAASTEPLIFGNTLSNPAFDFGNPGILSIGPWTPPQYSKPAQTMITVAGTTNSNTGQVTQNPTNYVFDAVFRIRHKRTLKKTSHPVLTGVNISDHAYMEPAKVVLEIGMSDAMAAYDASVWLGSSSKSVSAWKILKSLQINRTILTLTSRLDTYYNMLIMDLEAPEDYRTNQSLKATVTLEELISASVLAIAPDSARPQTTYYSSSALVQPDDASNEQIINHQVLNSDGSTAEGLTGSGVGTLGLNNSLGLSTIPGASVPGAGEYSSNSIYAVNTGTDTGNTGPIP